MLKKLIIKSNLNLNKMFFYGTIANLSLFSIVIFFGKENVMLAFPITLTALSLSLENIHIKTIHKFFKILSLDFLLITISYLSSFNIFLGFLINFITIFSISFFYTAKYNPKIYKPFIMLYVFTNFYDLTIDSYINCLFAITCGILIVFLFTLAINRKDKIYILEKSLSPLLFLQKEQFISLSKGFFNKDVYLKHSKEIRSLAYKIYITRYKRTFTTNIGKIQFDFLIILENLNILLKNTYSLKSEFSLEDILFFNEIIVLIDEIFNYFNSKNLYTLENSFNKIHTFKNSQKYKEIVSLFLDFEISINEFHNLKGNFYNKEYKEWSVSYIDRNINYFKNNFHLGSIRFNFALRIAITLSFTIFLGHFFSFYKIIWITITVMSVMQPYYEDTILNSKGRLKGNLLSLIFLILLLSIIDNKIINILTLIISLYLTYGFKEYYKLSLFTSMASLSIASLSNNLSIVATTRVLFLILGILISYLSNRFIFPYKLENGINELLLKISKYNYLIIESLNNDNLNRGRDLILLNILITDKLLLRNLQFKDNRIPKLLEKNLSSIIILYYYKLKKG